MESAGPDGKLSPHVSALAIFPQPQRRLERAGEEEFHTPCPGRLAWLSKVAVNRKSEQWFVKQPYSPLRFAQGGTEEGRRRPILANLPGGWGATLTKIHQNRPLVPPGAPRRSCSPSIPPPALTDIGSPKAGAITARNKPSGPVATWWRSPPPATLRRGQVTQPVEADRRLGSHRSHPRGHATAEWVPPDDDNAEVASSWPSNPCATSGLWGRFCDRGEGLQRRISAGGKSDGVPEQQQHEVNGHLSTANDRRSRRTSHCLLLPATAVDGQDSAGIVAALFGGSLPTGWGARRDLVAGPFNHRCSGATASNTKYYKLGATTGVPEQQQQQQQQRAMGSITRVVR